MHTSHIEFLASRHVEQSQVDGRAAGMSRFLGDVSPLEEERLVHLGIEIRLHQRVRQILPPTYEMVDSTLRPVSVVDLEPVTPGLYVVADFLQRSGRFTGIKHHRLQIAVHPRSDEIVGSEVARFDDGIGHDIGEVDESAAVHFRSLLRTPHEIDYDGNGQEYADCQPESVTESFHKGVSRSG